MQHARDLTRPKVNFPHRLQVATIPLSTARRSPRLAFGAHTTALRALSSPIMHHTPTLSTTPRRVSPGLHPPAPRHPSRARTCLPLSLYPQLPVTPASLPQGSECTHRHRTYHYDRDRCYRAPQPFRLTTTPVPFPRTGISPLHADLLRNN